jgi:hypothetical protein
MSSGLFHTYVKDSSVINILTKFNLYKVENKDSSVFIIFHGKDKEIFHTFSCVSLFSLYVVFTGS